MDIARRLDLKKRLIHDLWPVTWADARMIFDEYEVDDAGGSASTQTQYVRDRIKLCSNEDLIAIDGYLHRHEREDQPPLAGLAEDQQNTPFTDAEQAQIARVLEGVLQEAREGWELEAEQQSRLEAKVAYLLDAAKRVGRKDWLVIVYCVIMDKVVGAALEPSVANKVVHSVGDGLAALFGHPPMLGP